MGVIWRGSRRFEEVLYFGFTIFLMHRWLLVQAIRFSWLAEGLGPGALVVGAVEGFS